MATFFKKINPLSARWQTLVLQRADGISAMAGGRTWRLESASPSAAPCGAVLYAVWGAAEVAVWMDDWRVAVSAVLGESAAAAAELPESLVLASLECFASEGLAALERAVGLPASLTRLVREPSTPPASACFFRLRRDDGLVLALAWTVADKDGSWQAATEKALLSRTPGRGSLPGDLPLSGVVALGGWAWPASELAWSMGDVLLPPGGVEAGGLRTLTVGRALRFAARAENGILSVEGKTMTSAVPAPAAAPLDAVEVELSAEVGRLTLTLAQLRQLGEGQILEFSTPVEAPVALAVGGKAVACGELIDVGGRVGVRITSMIPSPANEA